MNLCNVSPILKFILFADDTNVFHSGVDIQTLCECISRELDKQKKKLYSSMA